ncbi:MAG: hypothetical protein LBM39_02215 [Candidatus Methanoplasma sp.]|jgi:predicted RNase H-like nuclease (RuvC/YqgF family)|nr:hypothetical protein [Candidatus Methanoplasma sp.]
MTPTPVKSPLDRIRDSVNTDSVLTQKIESLEKDNAILKNNAETLNNEKNALASKNNSLSSELNALRNNLASLQNEIQVRDNVIQTDQEKSSALTKENSELRSKVDTLSREISGMKTTPGTTGPTADENKEITSLKTEIRTRDNTITQLQKENERTVATLSSENTSLKSKITVLSKEVDELRTASTGLRNNENVEIASLKTEIRTRDNTITQLQEDNKRTAATLEKDNVAVRKTVDSLNAENSVLRSKVDLLSKEVSDLKTSGPSRSATEVNKEISDLRAELVKYGDVLLNVQNERDENGKTAVRYQEELQKERENTRKKLSNSYTPEDLSNYLSKVVDSFNTRPVGDSAAGVPVSYLINGMDVDLKTQVFTDGTDLKFVTADPASNNSESMSTFKISIRAVPK